MKQIRLWASILTLCLTCLPLLTPLPSAQAATFAYGADIGWLAQLEDNGVTWQNDNGVTTDPLIILQNHGINAVRLRVFVNPDSSAMWYKDDETWTMLGYADKASVITAALRAQALGMRVMVDFHYSDVFADPSHQIIPADWEGDSLSELVEDVYNHTYDVMTALIAAGVTPEWAQVGNEINSGILLPTGSSDDFSSLTQLLNAGYEAVKAASSSTKVITHLADGYDNDTFRWFFDNFITKYGGETDVIGMSYYPYWADEDYSDLEDDLATNLDDMASRYDKDVMIVETGGLETSPTDTYWTVLDAIKLVKAVPDDRGIGVFYWEPEANSAVVTDGYELGATTETADNVLQFTHALDAFADGQITLTSGTAYQIINRNSGLSLNVVDGSTQSGANIEQYTDGGWDSQNFYFENNDNGYFTIENANSSKLLDVEDESTDNGAQIIQYGSNGDDSQQWLILDAGDGYYKIRNRNSGLLMDIDSLSTDDGALCIQWEDNDGWNQEWQIEAQ